MWEILAFLLCFLIIFGIYGFMTFVLMDRAIRMDEREEKKASESVQETNTPKKHQ